MVLVCEWHKLMSVLTSVNVKEDLNGSIKDQRWTPLQDKFDIGPQGKIIWNSSSMKPLNDLMANLSEMCL